MMCSQGEREKGDDEAKIWSLSFALLLFVVLCFLAIMAEFEEAGARWVLREMLTMNNIRRYIYLGRDDIQKLVSF